MATCATAASSPQYQARLVTRTPPRAAWSGDGLDRLAGDLDDLVDLVLLDDQRRRHGERVARLAHHQAEIEGLHERLVAARADRPLGSEIDAAGHAEVADVGDVGQALQRVHALLPVRRQLGRAL